MGRCERLFQGPVEQMKINRYDQAAQKDTFRKLEGQKCQSECGHYHQQYPVCAGYKFEYSILYLHTNINKTCFRY